MQCYVYAATPGGMTIFLPGGNVDGGWGVVRFAEARPEMFR
jgi:hypothetical protein